MENMNNNPSDEECSSLPKEKLLGNEPLNQINGFWYFSWSIPGVKRTLNEFKPLHNDVILASFPKTGTTWLKSLLFSITNRSSIDSLRTTNPHELVPFLELQVYGDSTEAPEILDYSNLDCHRTRLFSTHIPYQLLGKALESSGCRVVYVTRNPKDALISMWHFINKNRPWPLDEAVDEFCSGIIPFGPYYENVLGYRKASLENPRKVFFVTYEELKMDTKTHVKRLAEFLGYPIDEEEEVEKVVKSCSFEVLSSHEVNKGEDILNNWFPGSYSYFFRKAIVGDHKNYLDAKVIQRIDELTRLVLFMEFNIIAFQNMRLMQLAGRIYNKG